MLQNWNTREVDWVATSKGWVRNDVAIDLKAYANTDPTELGLDPGKLVASPSNPPSITEINKVKGQSLDLAKVAVVRRGLELRSGNVSAIEQPKILRAIRRLKDLEKSENILVESRPVVDVHLIPSCGMQICDGVGGQPNNAVARDNGLVLLCNGSTGTKVDIDMRKMVGGVASSFKRILIDDLATPPATQMPTPNAPSGYQQAIIAFESVNLA
jgi:hypothetical protein